jgi:hypothetical protein
MSRYLRRRRFLPPSPILSRARYFRTQLRQPPSSSGRSGEAEHFLLISQFPTPEPTSSFRMVLWGSQYIPVAGLVSQGSPRGTLGSVMWGERQSNPQHNTYHHLTCGELNFRISKEKEILFRLICEKERVFRVNGIVSGRAARQQEQQEFGVDSRAWWVLEP